MLDLPKAICKGNSFSREKKDMYIRIQLLLYPPVERLKIQLKFQNVKVFKKISHFVSTEGYCLSQKYETILGRTVTMDMALQAQPQLNMIQSLSEFLFWLSLPK